MRVLKFVVRTLIALVALAAIVVGAAWGVAKVMSSGAIKTVADIPGQDVAIVFGASVQQGKPSAYLQGRLNVAADLYNAGKVRVILVSGSTDIGYDEPATMKQALIEVGIPAERIVTDDQGIDTWSTCARARKVFGVRQAILVSQTYHLPRAVSTCIIAGIQTTAVGDDSLPKDDTWKRYERRELAGDVKMLFDWARSRKLTDETASTAVTDALSAVG
jgi:vancomycin permeability regulator SanA